MVTSFNILSHLEIIISLFTMQQTFILSYSARFLFIVPPALSSCYTYSCVDFIYSICCAILILFWLVGWLNKLATLEHLKRDLLKQYQYLIQFHLNYDKTWTLQTFIKGLLLGGRGSVWNRCVTCESNVCSEQTSENLVDKILDQLRKKA